MRQRRRASGRSAAGNIWGKRAFARSRDPAEEREHRATARRTWTLDALRAATEPVKVEAMQAIVMVGDVVGCVVCAGEWRFGGVRLFFSAWISANR